jgi:hypothetical protein
MNELRGRAVADSKWLGVGTARFAQMLLRSSIGVRTLMRTDNKKCI